MNMMGLKHLLHLTMNESGLKLRIEIMKIKQLLTISLAVLLTACTNQNDSIPIQSNEYKEPVPVHTPIRQDNDGIDASDVALGVATGAVVGATGYAVGKYTNKPRYSKTRTVYGKPKASYSKPVVVVNKHYYYQTKPKVRVSRYKRK